MEPTPRVRKSVSQPKPRIPRTITQRPGRPSGIKARPTRPVARTRRTEAVASRAGMAWRIPDVIHFTNGARRQTYAAASPSGGRDDSTGRDADPDLDLATRSDPLQRRIFH